MVSVCTVPARGGGSCEHFGGYKTINRIPLLIEYFLMIHSIFMLLGSMLPGQVYETFQIITQKAFSGIAFISLCMVTCLFYPLKPFL